MNIFRILGDLSHTASKIILIYAIHSNRSAEGVSLLTQILYTLVFGTRYLDLFWVPPWWSWWNFLLKLFYISSSIYVVFVMMKVFPRTREKEGAWKITIWSLLGCLISAPIVELMFEGKRMFEFGEILWTFSIELESVCVLPQLLLLRQTSVPTVINSGYLVALGAYRLLYLLNWIVRLVTEFHFDSISVIFGIIQTLLYVDFAWVYYTRQRVKLRGGGVVDSDDLSKSFLVRRFIGNRRSGEQDEDIADEDEALAGQENGTTRPQRPNWGARGLSVSADDTLDQHHAGGQPGREEMTDPDAFEDEDYDEDADAAPKKQQQDIEHEQSDTANSASEWAESAGGNKARDSD